MHLDRTNTEVQMRGYLFVRQALCDKTQNRKLPGRKTDCRCRSGYTFRLQRCSWGRIWVVRNLEKVEAQAGARVLRLHDVSLRLQVADPKPLVSALNDDVKRPSPTPSQPDHTRPRLRA